MINEIELTCEDGLVFLKQVENGSVDLILMIRRISFRKTPG